MNKKLLSVLIAVLLIVTMSVCLFACSGEETQTTKKAAFGIKEGTSSKTTTKQIYINENQIIWLNSTADLSESDVQAKISVKDVESGEVLAVRATKTAAGKYRVAPVGGTYTSGKWYDFAINDSVLSFADFSGVTKLAMFVLSGNGTATLNENVVYLTGGNAYISNFAENGALKTFEFDAIAANQTLSMGQIVLVEDAETGDYTAYQVLGVQETANAGIYTVSYASPSYEEVYDKLEANETAVLGKDGEVTIKEDEIIETISSQLSLVGFDAGKAHFNLDANVDKDNLKANVIVEVTIPDVLGEKDGINSLDLGLTFTIETKITVGVDISIGALLSAAENGIALDAKFDNTLKLNVEIKDGVEVTEVSQLDAVLEKIAKLVRNQEEDDISIDVFNWIIPIGNGIAAINFDVNLDMNFEFSGKLGVESTSNAVINTKIYFNPATEEKKFELNGKPEFNFESVNVYLDGNATAYIGIDAAIKFDLLGGVISVGVGAEVGNFNRLYGKVGSTNLLAEDKDFFYGVYLEGGIYYDAKFLYNVAKITSGSISFLGGRQEKTLYTAGSPYVVTGLQDTTMTVGIVPQDIAIQCTYDDITNGTSVGTWTNIIDAKKIKEVAEANADANYVEIKDGQIYLTDEGIAADLNSYYVTVEADGIQADITIKKIETIYAAANSEVTVTVGNSGNVFKPYSITAAYLDGTTAEVTYRGALLASNAKIKTGDAGVIILYKNGEAIRFIVVE